MTKSGFHLETSFDAETGHLVAAYLRVRGGEVAGTREVVEGVAYADYDSEGLLLGVELLGPCDGSVLDGIAEQEPEPIKQFLKAAAPRGLVPAAAKAAS